MKIIQNLIYYDAHDDNNNKANNNSDVIFERIITYNNDKHI